MRVRATAAFSAVRDCQIIDISPGDEMDGDLAVYLMATGAAVEPLNAPEPEAGDRQGTAPGVDEPPIDGKIEDVLAWVGDDTDRALVAHDAEEAKGDKARSTLLARLAEIVQN